MVVRLMNYRAWGRLKQITFLLDLQRDHRGPSLRASDTPGLYFMDGGTTTPEAQELHELVYELDLVAPRYRVEEPVLCDIDQIHRLDLTDTCRDITTIYRGDRFAEGWIAEELNSGRIQKLCRNAYHHTINRDGWPTHLPTNTDGTLAAGITVRSLTATIEGRTTGGRYKCPSRTCHGWLIAVLWETGQRLHICTEGWHYDPDTNEIRVAGGGEISARFISPSPLGTPPLPREQWIPRDQLLKQHGWITAS